MMCLALHAGAKEIPNQLPEPDGKAGDPTKPVKVYILAGQSNMVDMGTIAGARCRYTIACARLRGICNISIFFA